MYHLVKFASVILLKPVFLPFVLLTFPIVTFCLGCYWNVLLSGDYDDNDDDDNYDDNDDDDDNNDNDDDNDNDNNDDDDIHNQVTL